ncbi:IS4 family transposase [Bacteroides acidifaciens]|uniref:IS4 family transposase n=1 Tax=Bacteroides acidifaciens TaxID=85831 RepID=UPI00261D15E9|nr:IS4 family transposase [Bacteroides acidifaciens]
MVTHLQEQRKDSELLSSFQEFFAGKMNLARIKFLVILIQALCKVQTVSLYKLATAFDGGRDHMASHRRIQRFFAAYVLNLDLVARFIFFLLPEKDSLVLSMDRTNWKFGDTDINVLTLAVAYKGVGFPILFTMLPKRGNSNTEERINLMDRFVRLFGKKCIDCLTADREFVGSKWIGYLNSMRIRYHIRIKENFWVHNPKSSEKVRVRHLFHGVHVNEEKWLPNIYLVKGEYCYLAAARYINRDGNAELQVIISYNKPEQSVQKYKLRWQIECAFKAMKSSGFNIEDTHLYILERVERLFAVICIALCWAYLVGLAKHYNLKPIKTLPNGYLAKSFVKYGLEEIAHVLYNQSYISLKSATALIR